MRILKGSRQPEVGGSGMCQSLPIIRQSGVNRKNPAKYQLEIKDTAILLRIA